jgi:haloalkane dehalogenase
MSFLNLKNITFVFGGWGGPIALSYAVKNPDKIKSLIITNTWFWSVRNNWYYQAFSKFVGGPIGKFLIKKNNFFVKTIVKMVFGDKKKLTKDIHMHYIMPLINPNERKGSWVFPKQIIGSSKWLNEQGEKISVLKNKKVLIAWGMKDIAFRKKELQRWIKIFPKAKVVRYLDAGHFVAEEKPLELANEIIYLNKKNK